MSCNIDEQGFRQEKQEHISVIKKTMLKIDFFVTTSYKDFI